MSALADIILAFCISLVAIGLVSILVPSGSTEKPMKMLIAITMMAMLMAPFLKGDINWDFTTENLADNRSLEDTAVGRARAMAESQMELALSDLLNRNEIEVDEILVNMDICEDGSIFISQISISSDFTSGDEMQAVKNIVKEELGVDVEVIDKGGIKDGI